MEMPERALAPEQCPNPLGGRRWEGEGLHRPPQQTSSPAQTHTRHWNGSCFSSRAPQCTCVCPQSINLG